MEAALAGEESHPCLSRPQPAQNSGGSICSRRWGSPLAGTRRCSGRRSLWLRETESHWSCRRPSSRRNLWRNAEAGSPVRCWGSGFAACRRHCGPDWDGAADESGADSGAGLSCATTKRPQCHNLSTCVPTHVALACGWAGMGLRECA